MSSYLVLISNYKLLANLAKNSKTSATIDLANINLILNQFFLMNPQKIRNDLNIIKEPKFNTLKKLASLDYTFI